MKSARKRVIAFLASLALGASAAAQSPRTQLQQMVEQLQKAPGDSALREKVIRLGAEIKPAPAIPEEANRVFVKGNVFQKEAKDIAGYELAISAYREALRFAPWWSDVYFNMAIAQELAGKFNEAIVSIRAYMASVPASSAEAREAQNKIYALEAKNEMAALQSATAVATQAKRFESNWHREVVNNISGARARYTWTARRDAGGVWRIEATEYADNNLRDVQLAGMELRFKYDHFRTHDDGRRESSASMQATATVTPDGNTLRIATTPIPYTSSQAAYWNSGRSPYPPKGGVVEYKK